MFTVLNKQCQSEELTSAKCNMMSTVATRTDVHNTFGSLLHVHVSKELAMLWRTLLILLTLSKDNGQRIV